MPATFRTLDVCIPTYNEALVIERALRSLRETLATLPGVSSRIVVADYAATDATADVVRALGFPDVVVLSVEARGKGAGVIEAARWSDADLFGFVDVDLSADPSHFGDLLAALDAGAHVAVGSRLHADASSDRSFRRSLPSWLFNGVRRAIVRSPILDSQCALKLATREGRELLATCREAGWFFDVEWLARADRAGLIVREVPIAWVEDRFPERRSKVAVLPVAAEAFRALRRIRAQVR